MSGVTVKDGRARAEAAVAERCLEWLFEDGYKKKHVKVAAHAIVDILGQMDVWYDEEKEALMIGFANYPELWAVIPTDEKIEGCRHIDMYVDTFRENESIEIYTDPYDPYKRGTKIERRSDN
jgi:hypothetical protein